MKNSGNGFQEKLSKFIAMMEKDPDILLAYLFGSHARNEAGPLSDIDLAVLLKPAASKELFAKKLRMLKELTTLFAGIDIDLVILNEAPLVLKFNILKDSKPLYICDNNLHDELILRAITEYLDFKPVLACHYQALQKRIEANQYAN